MATRRTAKCRLTRGCDGGGDGLAVTRAIPTRFVAFPRFSIARANSRPRRGQSIDRSSARSPIRRIHPFIRFCPFRLSCALSSATSLFFRLFASGRADDGERTLLARVRFAERRAAAVGVVHDKPLLGSDGSWLALSPSSSFSLSTLLRVLTFGRRRSLARLLAHTLVRFTHSFVCLSGERGSDKHAQPAASLRPRPHRLNRTSNGQTDGRVRSAGISFRLIR